MDCAGVGHVGKHALRKNRDPLLMFSYLKSNFSLFSRLYHRRDRGIIQHTES